MRVLAVVVTYNRKDLLLECLEALGRQTRPLDRIILVDNASTDGTVDAVRAAGLFDRLPLDLLQLSRNGGGSEGFHFGVAEALEDESDWLWLMDDDCEPADDALERLLAAPSANDPKVVSVVPAVRHPDGRLLPMARGHITPRLVRAPIVALPDAEYDRDEVALDFASFVGPMFRTSAVRAVGPPLREAFIRFEDLEYSARLRAEGQMRLIPQAVVAHKEAIPVTGSDLKTLWEDFSRGGDYKGLWKGVYGTRNVIYSGRRHGFVNAAQAWSYVLLQLGRAALFDDHKLRTMYLYAMYGYDGWRGLFRNVPPGRWQAAVSERNIVRAINREALRYDTDVTTRPATPAPATPAA
jgi:GT2 family glycosyltransferase